MSSFAKVLIPNYAGYETLFPVLVAGFAIIGKFSLTFWLLFRKGKRQLRLEAKILPAAGNTLGMENAR